MFVIGCRRAVVLLAIGLVSVSGACVPGYQVTSRGETATFTGRLVAGRAEFDGDVVDCDWLIGADSRRLTLIYPSGFEPRYHPFRLVDASGDVFAEEGDILRITYVTGGIGESVCPGEVQAAETVERVSPAPTRRPSGP
jgi:hypothetical protein